MRDSFIASLTELAKTNSRVTLLTGDLGFGVLEEFGRRFPSQFVNCGIAEQTMMGIAAGLASEGRICFVYSIANFPTLRSIEQFRNDVVYHNLPVIVVSVGSGVSYGTLGYSHHGVEDFSVMRSIGEVQISCPADPVETAEATVHLFQRHQPSYLRLGKNGEQTLTRISSFADQPIGPHLLRSGSDIAFLCCGTISSTALEASTALLQHGVSAEVWSVPLPTQLPQTWMQELSSRFSRLISVEEHCLNGGFGSLLLEKMNDWRVSKCLTRLGLDLNHSLVGSSSYLRNERGLSVHDLVRAGLDNE
jgi:transketolase